MARGPSFRSVTSRHQPPRRALSPAEQAAAAVPKPPPVGRRMHELEELKDQPQRLEAIVHRLEIDQRVFDAAAAYQPMLHNPSVCVHNGQLVVCIRALVEGVGRTKNFLGTLDPRTFELGDQREMRDLAPGYRNAHTRTVGYEDVRLFVRRGRLCGSATVCDRVAGDDRAKIAVLDLDELGNVVDCHLQPSDRVEKNWMPLITDGELRFVYGLEPSPIVLKYDDATSSVWPQVACVPVSAGNLRGSSQVIEYGRGYLCVVHQVHAGRPTYLHRFVFFDRFLQLAKLGRPFYFCELGIEFCAGLAALPGDPSHMLLSFGVRDRSAHVAVVHSETVERMLEP